MTLLGKQSGKVGMATRMVQSLLVMLVVVMVRA